MTDKLRGKKIAMLVADGFEQEELTRPKQALEEAGAQVEIISPSEGGQVKGWDHTQWGDKFPIDVHLENAKAEDYDALVLPGGVMNPDHLRRYDEAVEFAKHFFEAGKPIAAICHGPWLLAEADVLKGRKLTSYFSISTDLKNAGAEWVDEEVVVDRNLITSRKPADIPAFNREIIDKVGGA
ncbi:MAG: type 1 glutamine amidotransferase domain-containing protein [Anaerolineales bacterium]